MENLIPSGKLGGQSDPSFLFHFLHFTHIPPHFHSTLPYLWLRSQIKHAAYVISPSHLYPEAFYIITLILAQSMTVPRLCGQFSVSSTLYLSSYHTLLYIKCKYFIQILLHLTFFSSPYSWEMVEIWGHNTIFIEFKLKELIIYPRKRNYL